MDATKSVFCPVRDRMLDVRILWKNGPWTAAQELEIRSLKEGSGHHIGSNLKAGVRDIGMRLEVLRRFGQWSEKSLGRCLRAVSGKVVNHWGDTKALSILSIIGLTLLRFVQVNRWPWKPTSIRLQSLMHELKGFILWHFGAFPPNFSETWAISLKSPTTNQFPFTVSEKPASSLYKNFRNLTLGLP